MNFRALSSIVRVCVILLLPAALIHAADQQPKQIEIGSLHNTFDLGGGVFSGSSPAGDADFAALAKLGVKSVVSVDGSKPDVAAAKRYGIRYIHLPIGYDGISAERARELAKVAKITSGPVFVHCHHGKHRGPAAAALICETKNGWSSDVAVAWMQQAGTAKDYAGLYKSVREFQVPDAAALAKVPDALPETAATPPMVDIMVAMDESFDHLKAAQKAGWREVSGHPDITPVQAATLLWEHYREMGRAPDLTQQPTTYRTILLEGEKASDALRGALTPGGSAEARDAAFKRVGGSCTDCHKAHRN